MENIMKKSLKILSLCLVFVLVAGFFAGCGAPKEKSFYKEGLTITLTDEFEEKALVDSLTASYTSDYCLVTTLKEDFSLFSEAGLSVDISESEYLDMVIQSNSLENEPEETDGLHTVTFTKEVSGQNMTYFALAKRGTDAFWLVQFACPTDTFENMRPQFIKWAKTVTVE